MTPLLEQAFAGAAALPPEEQDALAAWMLAELRAGRRWPGYLTRPEPEPGQLADEALTGYLAGRTTRLPKEQV